MTLSTLVALNWLCVFSGMNNDDEYFWRIDRTHAQFCEGKTPSPFIYFYVVETKEGTSRILFLNSLAWTSSAQTARFVWRFSILEQHLDVFREDFRAEYVNFWADSLELHWCHKVISIETSVDIPYERTSNEPIRLAREKKNGFQLGRARTSERVFRVSELFSLVRSRYGRNIHFINTADNKMEIAQSQYNGIHDSPVQIDFIVVSHLFILFSCFCIFYFWSLIVCPDLFISISSVCHFLRMPTVDCVVRCCRLFSFVFIDSSKRLLHTMCLAIRNTPAENIRLPIIWPYLIDRPICFIWVCGVCWLLLLGYHLCGLCIVQFAFSILPTSLF